MPATKTKPAAAPAPHVEQYKGQPILVLPIDEKYTFSFGVKKARLILRYLDSIKKFVQDNDTPAAAGN